MTSPDSETEQRTDGGPVEIPGPIEEALDEHDAFTVADDRTPRGERAESRGYVLETTVFENFVTARDVDGERDGRVTLAVWLPTIDAAVAGERVAGVVEDDWFETLKRRLADVAGVATAEAYETPALERRGERVRVDLEFVAENARTGVEDAKASVEFVEGTFAQGMVPGYEYRGEAATLRQNAQERGRRSLDGDGPPP